MQVREEEALDTLANCGGHGRVGGRCGLQMGLMFMERGRSQCRCRRAVSAPKAAHHRRHR
jgi:hypothetical protein